MADLNIQTHTMVGVGSILIRFQSRVHVKNVMIVQGMILRSYSISIKNHPHMMLQAKRLQIDVFDGITTQFWLGLYPEEDLHICAGDHLHITWEYVPTVKYATDISATEKAYYQLILDHPDIMI